MAALLGQTPQASHSKRSCTTHDIYKLKEHSPQCLKTVIEIMMHCKGFSKNCLSYHFAVACRGLQSCRGQISALFTDLLWIYLSSARRRGTMAFLVSTYFQAAEKALTKESTMSHMEACVNGSLSFRPPRTSGESCLMSPSNSFGALARHTIHLIPFAV